MRMYIALETRASLAGQQLVVAVGGGSYSKGRAREPWA